MGTPATYRVRSTLRGIEGPLTASAVVSMAKAGLIREGDEVEAAPGKWLPVTSSPPVRDAIRERRGDRMFLTAASSAAALVSLRFAAGQLTSDSKGLAVLLAVAAQHPVRDVAEHAACLLQEHDPDNLGLIARRVLRVRVSRGHIWPGNVRMAIARALSEEQWREFVMAAREVRHHTESFGGVWQRDTGLPTSLADALNGRDRELPTSLGEASEAIIRQADGADAEETVWSINASGYPIVDVEGLSSRAQDLLKVARNVDLSNTPLVRIPGWLVCRAGSLNLSGSAVSVLPELEGDYARFRHDQYELSDDHEKCDLDLSRTSVTRLPDSWNESRFIDSLTLDRCPLHDASFESMPTVSSLSAQGCRLRQISKCGGVPARLDLSDNPLDHIPECIASMRRLRSLTMARCMIPEIPAWLEDRKEPLHHLYLSGNPIRSISFRRGYAPVRHTLDLSYCRISDVAAGSLSRPFAGSSELIVGELNLSNNRLQTLPAMWYPKVLDVSSNPLQALPEPLNTFDYDPTKEPDPDEQDPEQDWFESSAGPLAVTASETMIEVVPDSLSGLPLGRLSLSGCARMRSLPAAVVRMGTLHSLDLSGAPIVEVRGEAAELAAPMASEEFRSWLEEQQADSLSLCMSRSRAACVGLVAGHIDRPFTLDLSGAFAKSIGRDDLSGSVTELNLSESAVESLPESIGDFKALTSLDLSGTPIDRLPPDLGSLRNLESLSLPPLDPSAYPSGLEGLQSLKRLHISGYRMARIPDFVFELGALEVLTVSDSSIQELPVELARCRSLTIIDIKNAAACRVHGAVMALPALERVDLSARGVVSFDAIPAGCNIRHLSVDGPEVHMPDSVEGFDSLNQLELSAVALYVPHSLFRLTSLTGLSLGWQESAGKFELLRRLPAGTRALIQM